MSAIRYVEKPPLANEVLNRLFAATAPDGEAPECTAGEEVKRRDCQLVLRHSLVYLGAFHGKPLVGFVNVAWDGGLHGFLLDPTVHPTFRRRGIGLELVRRATVVAAVRGLEWLHVDYEENLAPFYDKAGFASTRGGLNRLNAPRGSGSAVDAPAG